MKEQEGFRQILISESVYQDFEQRRKEAESNPVPVAALRQQSGNYCGGPVETDKDGVILGIACADCGWWDRFLGRSCSQSTDITGGIFSFSCQCGGGWWNKLFKQ
jgi:hypothetical protein